MYEIAELNIAELSTAPLMAAIGVAAAVGLLYCFAGYGLIRFVLALTGFLLAGAVTAGLAGWFSQGRLVFMAGGMFVGGMAGAMAMYWMFRASEFCLGMFGAGIAAHTVLMGHSEPWVLWALIGAGVAGGLLALWLERPVIAVATAAIGALIVLYSAYLLAGAAGYRDLLADPVNRPRIEWALLSCWVGLAIAGAMTQFAAFKSKRK